MARQAIPKASEQLLALIGQHTEGMSVKQLLELLGGEASPRNLQRWLAALVQAGRLEKIGGRGQGVRYRLISLQAVERVEEWEYASDAVSRNDGWDLSREAERLLAKISRPLSRREPVGYRRSFLDNYVPNETYLLPAMTRTRLHQLGSLPQGNQPAGTYARDMLQRLLIDLSWNSSRLEGNTYSLLETEKLLLRNEESVGKNAMETQMLLNHKDAIEFLVESAEDVGFNVYTVRNLHALLSNNLLGNPDACGRIRQMPVHISGTSYVPLAMPGLIQELFELLLKKSDAITDPFEQSFFAMVHLSYLQAFEDVNKRVSRLAANIPFIRHNLCPLSFVDMPQDLYVKGLLAVYELNETELLQEVFVQAYEHSVKKYAVVRESLGEPDAFRLQFRNEIMTLIGAIVVEGLQRTAALRLIKEKAATLPKMQQARFIEVVETELQSLNEGNMARYRIRPAQYRVWREQW